MVRARLPAGMLDRLAGKLGILLYVANGFEIFFINVHKLSDTAYALQSGRKSLSGKVRGHPLRGIRLTSCASEAGVQ